MGGDGMELWFALHGRMRWSYAMADAKGLYR